MATLVAIFAFSITVSSSQNGARLPLYSINIYILVERYWYRRFQAKLSLSTVVHIPCFAENIVQILFNVHDKFPRMKFQRFIKTVHVYGKKEINSGEDRTSKSEDVLNIGAARSSLWNQEEAWCKQANRHTASGHLLLLSNYFDYELLFCVLSGTGRAVSGPSGTGQGKNEKPIGGRTAFTAQSLLPSFVKTKTSNPAHTTLTKHWSYWCYNYCF